MGQPWVRATAGTIGVHWIIRGRRSISVREWRHVSCGGTTPAATCITGHLKLGYQQSRGGGGSDSRRTRSSRDCRLPLRHLPPRSNRMVRTLLRCTDTARSMKNQCRTLVKYIAPALVKHARTICCTRALCHAPVPVSGSIGPDDAPPASPIVKPAPTCCSINWVIWSTFALLVGTPSVSKNL